MASQHSWAMCLLQTVHEMYAEHDKYLNADGGPTPTVEHSGLCRSPQQLGFCAVILWESAIGNPPEGSVCLKRIHAYTTVSN
jgi:hypothetical protein